MQWTGGPQYCETPAFFTPGTFPVEPFNTYSNLTIIFFAVVGFVFVIRRAPRAFDLYFLCSVLLVNGASSFLWHGLRDRVALRIDVNAGLLFLIGLFFLWARRVMPLWQAVLFSVAFYFVAEFFDEINLVPYGRWASIMPAILLFGSYLIFRTSALSMPAAYIGSVAIGSAMLALTFRTIDREQFVCDVLPNGTHFLWHGFLSAAAFMGILAMIALARAGAAQTQTGKSVPLGAPAE